MHPNNLFYKKEIPYFSVWHTGWIVIFDSSSHWLYLLIKEAHTEKEARCGRQTLRRPSHCPHLLVFNFV